MKTRPEDATVLVASDSVGDASQVVGLLQDQHPHIRASTTVDSAAAEFEEFKPDVLVLAFDAVDKAERYSLGLYRQSPFVRQHRHRTVLLCSKEELRACVDLCKKGIFDDYVLHWPLAQDGLRLTMSVWAAAREMLLPEPDTATREGTIQAKHLGEMNALIVEQREEGERRVATGTQAFAQAESEIGAAIDAFSRRLSNGQGAQIAEVKNAAAWSREIEQLKQAGVSRALGKTTRSLAPIAAWPGQVQERLMRPLEEIRASNQRTRNARPGVLAVEDDSFARKLIANALSEKGYVLLFAENGAEAFGVLRRIRPALILMDINLPDIDGVTLVRQVKAVPHLTDIPVLMLTGDARREAVAESIKAGASGFIVKPFTKEALLANVQKVLVADGGSR